MTEVPKIALFEPDIPQNTAAIIRTCACLGAKLEIIEPCGFLLSDNRFKRVVMDYLDEKEIKNKIKNGFDIIGRKETYKFKKLDNSFPKYLIKNKKKYTKWIV